MKRKVHWMLVNDERFSKFIMITEILKSSHFDEEKEYRMLVNDEGL